MDNGLTRLKASEENLSQTPERNAYNRKHCRTPDEELYVAHIRSIPYVSFVFSRSINCNTTPEGSPVGDKRPHPGTALFSFCADYYGFVMIITNSGVKVNSLGIFSK